MALFSIFDISSSALTAQSQRMNVSASNLANAESVSGPDGEPYRAKQLIFEAASKRPEQIGGVRVTEVIESDEPFRMEYNPSHPLADDKGYIRKPNVEPVHEMIDMMSASRSYQANVEVMNTSKQLLMKTLTLGEN